MDAKEEARKVLDNYFSALRAQDWEKLKGCFPDDDTLVYFGTDEGESWVGWEEVGPFLQSQMESFERVMVNRTPLSFRELAGREAVVFCELDEMIITSGGKRHDASVRFSGTLEKIGSQWVITHLHRSIPAPKPVVAYEKIRSVRY